MSDVSARKSQSEGQRTEIYGKSTSTVWPTPWTYCSLPADG